ncbi:MAG TPA: hypothetical protein VNP96_11765 [Solirubrobacterales bacterium]|nr:hypothetical protein [Solirubrobacterales bacterium]
MQSAQPLAQLLDPRAAGRLGHRALLEGAEVALKRLGGAAPLGVDPLQLRLALGATRVQLGEGLGDRLAHHRFTFEHGEKLTEDRLLQLVGGKPFSFARLLAVALAREAHVVAVATAVAVGRSTQVALAAVGTLDEPGQQVLGLVGAAQRDVLAAFPKDLLNALEEILSTKGSCGAE